MRWIPIFALLTASLLAEPQTVAEWTAALTKTFSAQPGFIAVYHSEGENKTLDATLALDTASGLSYLRLIVFKNGQRMEGRFWNTEGGDIFVDALGQRAYYPTKSLELEALKQLFPHSEAIQPATVPGLLLDNEGVGASYELKSAREPSWAESAKEGSLGKLTRQTVTFSTREHGDLTIDRGTGMMIRQSLVGPGGEKRVLEQVSYQVNPGKDAIFDISSRWELAGAETILRKEQMAAMRLRVFQQLVDAVDRQEVGTKEFTKWIEEKKPGLRRLAGFVLQDHPDSIFGQKDWKVIFANLKTDIHTKWAQRAPADQQSDEALNAHFKLSATRHSFASGFADQYITSGKGSAVTEMVFGKNSPLKASSAEGKAAIAAIEEAFVRASFEATLLPVMNELWGKVKE